MTETEQQKIDFNNVYNKSYRLTAGVFVISNLIETDEQLKTKIKNLSLNLVSKAIELKDINFFDCKKIVVELEKISLELMSLLDIASVVGLISKMNGNIIKEEFQSFISELDKFNKKFEEGNFMSVKDILNNSPLVEIGNNIENINNGNEKSLVLNSSNFVSNQNQNNQINGNKNGNGHKRKDQRRSAIFDFIKGHNETSIKDIVPNITGCSEKTVQRELIELIKEGKIKKTGERRWSKYSII